MMRQRAEPINLAEVYTLIKGVAVIGRSGGTVQIGGEPPRAVLLHHPPPHTVSILKGLNGTVSAREVLAHHSADVDVWGQLLAGLHDSRLLVRVADWSFPSVLTLPFLEPERDSLVHRHGVATAGRILVSRRDAVVVVRGSGRIATAIATSLAASGIGHVHQQPDRTLRLADLLDVPRPESAPVRSDRGVAAAPHPQDDRRGPGVAGPPVGDATKADTSWLATNLRRAAPHLKTHAPAAHLRLALVVLAGDGPPAPSLAAELTGRRVPHLAARAGLISAVVGPLVLPGRSTCLLCALRWRTELDGDREEIEEGLRREIVVPPTLLVFAATAMAVADALDHIDGINVPATVDGTVEWQLGDVGPRRRSWSMHPECGCSRASSPVAHR